MSQLLINKEEGDRAYQLTLQGSLLVSSDSPYSSKLNSKQLTLDVEIVKISMLMP